MINREHIEQILKLNGLKPSSPDDEIKALLISARWHKDDVETALVVLREDYKKQTQHVDTVHQVFNSDSKVNPETLNSILGIDVEIKSVMTSHHKSMENAYRMQIFSIVVVSIVLSALFLVYAMWFLRVGVFNSYV